MFMDLAIAPAIAAPEPEVDMPMPLTTAVVHGAAGGIMPMPIFWLGFLPLPIFLDFRPLPLPFLCFWAIAPA